MSTALQPQDESKLHAAELETAFTAWRQGVLDEKGIHSILGDVIRAVDAHRRARVHG